MVPSSTSLSLPFEETLYIGPVNRQLIADSCRPKAVPTAAPRAPKPSAIIKRSVWIPGAAPVGPDCATRAVPAVVPPRHETREILSYQVYTPAQLAAQATTRITRARPAEPASARPSFVPHVAALLFAVGLALITLLAIAGASSEGVTADLGSTNALRATPLPEREPAPPVTLAALDPSADAPMLPATAALPVDPPSPPPAHSAKPPRRRWWRKVAVPRK